MARSAAPCRWGYEESRGLAGPLVSSAPVDPTVQYRTVTRGVDRVKLAALVALNLVASLLFLVWLVLPSHLPLQEGGAWSLPRALALVAFTLLVALEMLRIAQNSTIWAFAARMRDPVPVIPEPGLRVAVLTTIVPSKEPVHVLARTLRAMCNIEYDGTVDVWVLDEGDDPSVKAVARRLGVHHFSRKGRPEYNQPAGAYRSKTKSGNHNAWRAEHELDYDVVAQMDPDHCPLPDFLTRTLGFFRDPDVAFVVAPQVYGNGERSFIARAAADQSFLFHGVVQRGGNGLGAPLLIGTNHLYRPSAWRQIDGYQDSVIEDHLTSLRIHAATNPETGRRWKGVYTPDIVAIGEGPESWTDYFNQQRRWAYGVWDVLLRHSPTMFPRLSWGQRLSYAALQLFYPSVGLMWMCGTLLTGLYLGLGVTAIYLHALPWIALWGGTFVAQFALVGWLRRFNLAEHERRGMGMNGSLLSLFAGPVYAAAAAAAILKRKLSYVVTAKGDLASRDSWATFRLHVTWLCFALVALWWSLLAGHGYWILRLWAVFVAVVVTAPVTLFLNADRRERHLLWRVRGRRVTEAYFTPLREVRLAGPRAAGAGQRRTA